MTIEKQPLENNEKIDKNSLNSNELKDFQLYLEEDLLDSNIDKDMKDLKNELFEEDGDYIVYQEEDEEQEEKVEQETRDYSELEVEDMLNQMWFDGDDVMDAKMELKKARLYLWSGFYKDTIKNILSKIKNKESDDEEIRLSDKIQDDNLEFVFNYIGKYSGDVKNMLVDSTQIFGQLVYLQDKYNKLDKFQKEKLFQWLQDLLKLYKEWRKFELFKIEIDANGKLVIKWKINWEEVILVFDPKEKTFESIWWLKIDDTSLGDFKEELISQFGEEDNESNFDGTTPFSNV